MIPFCSFCFWGLKSVQGGYITRILYPPALFDSSMCFGSFDCALGIRIMLMSLCFILSECGFPAMSLPPVFLSFE